MAPQPARLARFDANAKGTALTKVKTAENGGSISRPASLARKIPNRPGETKTGANWHRALETLVPSL